MGRPSRDKGGRGEREVCALLRSHGFEVSRNPGQSDPAYEALDVKTDVRGIDGVHLQVKRQEVLKLPAWIEQAESEAPDESIPTVAFRRNYPKTPHRWWLALPLEDFLPLLRAWVEVTNR